MSAGSSFRFVVEFAAFVVDCVFVFDDFGLLAAGDAKISSEIRQVK